MRDRDGLVMGACMLGAAGCMLLLNACLYVPMIEDTTLLYFFTGVLAGLPLLCAAAIGKRKLRVDPLGAVLAAVCIALGVAGLAASKASTTSEAGSRFLAYWRTPQIQLFLGFCVAALPLKEAGEEKDAAWKRSVWTAAAFVGLLLLLTLVKSRTFLSFEGGVPTSLRFFSSALLYLPLLFCLLPAPAVLTLSRRVAYGLLALSAVCIVVFALSQARNTALNLALKTSPYLSPFLSGLLALSGQGIREFGRTLLPRQGRRGAAPSR